MKRTDDGALSFPKPQMVVANTSSEVKAIHPIVAFLEGDYPGSLGRLELTRSERYNMITFVPDAGEGRVARYTWYFLPDGTFDGTSAELTEPLGT